VNEQPGFSPHVEKESRRGRDYVRVTVGMTVMAADVAQALVIAWRAFKRAAAEGIEGWDTASASAEVQPADSPRKDVCSDPYTVRAKRRLRDRIKRAKRESREGIAASVEMAARFAPPTCPSPTRQPSWACPGCISQLGNVHPAEASQIRGANWGANEGGR
jgi:hypothetical protein